MKTVAAKKSINNAGISPYIQSGGIEKICPHFIGGAHSANDQAIRLLIASTLHGGAQRLESAIIETYRMSDALVLIAMINALLLSQSR